LAARSLERRNLCTYGLAAADFFVGLTPSRLRRLFSGGFVPT
jgi:hypothetical protein